MITIVDYGVGNIYSLKSSLGYLGIDAVLSENPDEILRADKIILPGVGAFGNAIKMLRSSGTLEALMDSVKKGTPLLGICLGMQLLFERSYEFGNHEGLGLIPGYVEDMRTLIVNKELDIPQMGWNALSFPGGKELSPLFKYTGEGSYVYFVHSYSAVDCQESIIAVTDYSYPVTAAVSKDNVYGLQFHPEKSGEVGLGILKAFGEL